MAALGDVASASGPMHSAVTGRAPTKLSSQNAMMRPRRWSGVRSCTKDVATVSVITKPAPTRVKPPSAATTVGSAAVIPSPTTMTTRPAVGTHSWDVRRTTTPRIIKPIADPTPNAMLSALTR
jgi:hypothetical protein